VAAGESAPPIWVRVYDGVRVEAYPTRGDLGRAAAVAVAAAMRAGGDGARPLRMVFAAAPSQEEFLAELTGTPGLPWPLVQALHLDEYVGLAPEAPQGFGNWLSSRLFHRVPLGAAHRLNGGATDLAAECRRYAGLLQAAPLDISCVGIGENGHLAFNDPPADLGDPEAVRVVELDARCRRQQVNDGCFPDLGAVPHRALTLTIPAILAARAVFCVVPAAAKAAAVRDALKGPVSPDCPASALRRHAAVRMFLDADSASLL